MSKLKIQFINFINPLIIHHLIHNIGFIPDLNSHLIRFCGEAVCQEFLLNSEHDIKLELNSNYDSGLLDLNFSPSSSFMVLLSSYDGPDYVNYFEFQAVIEINNIQKNHLGFSI